VDGRCGDRWRVSDFAVDLSYKGVASFSGKKEPYCEVATD